MSSACARAQAQAQPRATQADAPYILLQSCPVRCQHPGPSLADLSMRAPITPITPAHRSSTLT